MSLHKIDLTPNAEKVLSARYLKKDSNGAVIETPHDMFYRVARTVAEVERIYHDDSCSVEEVVDYYTEEFYNLMVDGLFLPNSPTLMNAGRDMGMLSACFVLPLEDSIEGIFSTVKSTALIQKAGGGTGFSFDKLRPNGSYINSSGGTTSGPISFWKVLSESTNAIQQGAFRRGANMGMMSVTHPDILSFIYAKQDLKAFNNFNISIKIPDSWMNDYIRHENGCAVVTDNSTGKNYVIPKTVTPGNYSLNDLVEFNDNELNFPCDKVWTKKDLFNAIAECAWKTGEPGLIFIDTINASNPTPHIGDIEATNPCGEQPLLPYEACNLGSINISKFIDKETKLFDIEKYKKVVILATRFLDNVIDANKYPLPEIEKMCKGNRKIGLGLMGFADLLYLQGVPYNSSNGIRIGEWLMKMLNDTSHDASYELAQQRCVFPNWSGSVWDTKHNRSMRNSATTTIAPTGTLSIIANCSGGIEPLFSLAFYRNVLNGQKLTEVNQVFVDKMKELGLHNSELYDSIANIGTIAGMKELPESVRNTFVCTHDISPDWHISMQAAFQRHCDSSISKTINLPHNSDKESILNTYIKAWKLKCKGITVYRDGCRDTQPMALSEKKGAETQEQKQLDTKKTKPIKTPAILPAVRIRQTTPFGNMHVVITVDPVTEKELEVFAQLGKAGDVAASDLEAINRMISLYLRIGGTIKDVIDQLEGIGSHMSIPTKDGRVMSLADGLGKTLHRYIITKEAHGLKSLLLGEVDVNSIPSLKEEHSASVNKTEPNESVYKVKCPECGNTLTFSEGCIKCNSCGYSKC